jgi:hypothetical protein
VAVFVQKRCDSVSYAFTDREVAEARAWLPEKLCTIRRVYVDQARVGVAIGTRIGRKL